MSEDNTSTTIRIRVKTKKKLDEIGRKNESYNDVIERLLKKWSEEK